MNLAALAIGRPVATTLLTLGCALAGAVAFFLLPVAPLPQVDYPTITVQASIPGASPETMAATVATPLERHLGQIADVSEMTSSSGVGSTRVTLQFGLDRDIDGAARDVQAAINAARADLPTTLRSNPTYRKFNPGNSSFMSLSMTSPTLSEGALFDIASTVVAQKLSQIGGMGIVDVEGSSLPAVRVELNPRALFKYAIGMEDVRAALASANANSPKGAVEVGERRFQIYTNDQARTADLYRDLVVGYRNGADVLLSDVAEVTDSVEDVRTLGLANGRRSIILDLHRVPGANIINIVRQVMEAMPELRASIPADVELAVAADRTVTIRSSLRDVERTLMLSVVLVIVVVFLFLRDFRATIIPSVAVPVSLICTFGVMYLLGYSLDNLSLMALTIATGFVVDDAVVVVENVMRHVEAGMPRMKAALQGTAEVGFTVISMSLSLVAVFIPILLMDGIVGRLFREFAITLSTAILVSLVVSLTTTPMMCALLLRPSPKGHPKKSVFAGVLGLYERSLGAALGHPRLTMLALLATVCLNVFLFIVIPKGFFPQQDTGRLIGGIQGDQSISFQLMRQKLTDFVEILRADPAVDTVIGYVGGGQTNGGFLSVSLKPMSERQLSADQVIARLRKKATQVTGASLFLQSPQDIRIGGRAGNSQYQYTLQADDLDLLRRWGPKLTEALSHIPELADVNSDQQDKGLETDLVIDRATASRLNLTAAQVSNTLYDAFGQRQVSTIYNPLNQYHVIMEVAPRYWQSPESLSEMFVSTAGGTVSGSKSTNAVAGTTGKTDLATLSTDVARNQSGNQLANTGRGKASTGAAVSTSAETMVPLAAFSHSQAANTALAVNHQGHFAATTISFNLPPDRSLSDAVTAIHRTQDEIGMPATVHGGFEGTAKTFQQSLDNQPLLILAALVSVYIVLGVLYESYVHPITIISTLPSAGVGAVLALLAFDAEFSIIAMIGVLLLIGIVKKNAIMMIDFALDAERKQGLTSREAITQACLLRFRPIMMTTMVALLGAMPLALGAGEGAEMRRPLGIAIVGGLIVSQLLTLYTTPVVYLYLDRLRLWSQERWRRRVVKEAA